MDFREIQKKRLVYFYNWIYVKYNLISLALENILPAWVLQILPVLFAVYFCCFLWGYASAYLTSSMKQVLGSRSC